MQTTNLLIRWTPCSSWAVNCFVALKTAVQFSLSKWTSQSCELDALHLFQNRPSVLQDLRSLCVWSSLGWTFLNAARCMFSHSQMQVLILAAPAEPELSLVQLSHNLLVQLMGRNTRQTNSTLKELTFGANAPSTTSFVDIIFKKCADSTRSTRVRCGCVCSLLCIKAHSLPLTTVSHCHDWRSWKLRLLQLCLTHT